MAVSSLAGEVPNLKPGQHPLKFKEEAKRTVEFSYLLYLPEGYEKESKQWPLILFLHGMGERGNNLELVKKHGPPKFLENRTDFPFVVVSPQCPDDRWWVTEDLNAFLDGILDRYHVDRDRVYMTGLSMGGFGTWKLAEEHPEKFAAIAPICGGGEPMTAWRLRDMPVWAFHGGKDSTVPVKRTKEMVEAIRKQGGHPRLTIYPDAGHDAWTQTYDNPKLYDWFLEHKRKK